jgi:hypothetical protein
MVLNRKPKQQRKQRRGTKRFAAGCGARKSKRTDMLQHGGVSPACVFDGASGNDVLYRNTGVNVHNTNPQASLDLDNKFMNYGGAVPLGSNILQGGAAKCGDEGRGGAGNGKSETFKQYLDSLTNNYNISGGGNVSSEPGKQALQELRNPEYLDGKGVESATTIPNTTPSDNSTGLTGSVPYTSLFAKTTGNSNNKTIPTAPSSNGLTAPSSNGLTGGGFSTDPSEYIAGLPVYKAYDDCCPPAIVNNQLVMGAPDQPVCGLGAIKGGARRRRTSTKRNNKNRRTLRRRLNRSQRGGAVGDFVYSATKSTPAPMSDAFNGPQGIFRYPDDMKTRAFDEVQPNYSVNAI